MQGFCGPGYSLDLLRSACVFVFLGVLLGVPFGGSVSMVCATRPSPPYLTDVTQTSAFRFQITVKPPQLLGYTGIGLIDAYTDTDTDTTNTATSDAPTWTYRLYVVDPDDSFVVTPIPDSCWSLQSNTSLVVDVTQLCSELSSLSSSSSTTPILVGSCPLPVLVSTGSFSFSMGISARNAAEEESAVTVMAYSDMNTLPSTSESEVLDVELDPNVAAGAGGGNSAKADTRWIMVLSVLLPVCVILAVVLLFMLYRHRLLREDGVHNMTKARVAFHASAALEDASSPSDSIANHVIEMQAPRLRNHVHDIQGAS